MAVDHVAAAPIEELDPALARGLPRTRLGLSDLHTVPLTVTAELGRVQMKVREVLALKVGSVVTLDRFAGQMSDVSINGLPMAKGEVVVMGDSLHVRLSESTAGFGGTGENRA